MSGFIRSLSKRFSKYTNPNLSLNDRFSDKEYDKNMNDIQSFFQKDHSLKDIFSKTWILTFACGFMPMHYFENHLIALIDRFTRSDIDRDELLEEIKTFKSVYKKIVDDLKIFEQNDGVSKMVLTLKNGKSHNIFKLSSLYPRFLETFPDLEGEGRHYKCHERSVCYALKIDDEYNPRVVTGSAWSLAPNCKYLHSWVKIDFNNKTFCVDNNYNMIVEEELYNKIFNPCVLSTLSKADIDKDRKFILQINKINQIKKNNHLLKMYLLDPNEAKEYARGNLSESKDEKMKSYELIEKSL